MGILQATSSTRVSNLWTPTGMNQEPLTTLDEGFNNLQLRPLSGKMTKTLSSELRFRWSWTFWKAYSKGYTTHIKTLSKSQWIKAVFHSKSHPSVQRTPKNLSPFAKLIKINSNTFSFANVPTPPSVHHHVYVLAFHKHFQRVMLALNSILMHMLKTLI
jgi:hypothetical protein